MTVRVVRRDRPGRRAGVTVMPAGELHLLRAVPGGASTVLNDTAMAIWDLCDGETSLEEMAWGVAALFDVPGEAASRDVARVIAELDEAGLVEWWSNGGRDDDVVSE